MIKYKLIKTVILLALLYNANRLNNIKRRIFDNNFINKINNLESIDINEKIDLNYIINYKGGSLEPEWDWVKNVSFVYTWVDGSDIDLSNTKSKYNGGQKNVNSRDRSADELRYSIRSLKKYLPWFNGTIFIVTDDQIPKWLNISNNKIKIISHKQIIPKYINPTFDSSTIECFLDKIPGISEIFLYMNDDFFFNNYVHPAFFFSSKNFYPKIFRSNIETINKTKVDKFIKDNEIHHIYGASVYFTYQIIRKYFDNNFTYYHMAHNAYICYRSLFEPFRLYFKEELKVVYTFRFRCPYKPVTIYLYQMLLLYLNNKLSVNSTKQYENKLIEFRKKIWNSNNLLMNYSFVIIPEELTNLFTKFSSINDKSESNYEHFNYFLNNRNILIYNINDKYSCNKSLYEFTEYMITRYPESTEFEKKNYVNLEKKYLNKIIGKDYIFQKLFFNNRKNLNDSTFYKMFFNKQNLDYIKEYLDEKNKLTKSKYISNSEKEELYTLFNYRGEKLKKEWKWIKNISIVYLLTENDINTINLLKYSLRSIEYYLPWFNGKIFIIVQCILCNIEWVNITNKHIKIIYPKDFIPKKIQIEYSKEIIEMYLDKIPEISERFIYLKHYYYFINYIHPIFFFNSDFYPKYNFGYGFKRKPKKIDPENLSFFKTYETITKFFGNIYIHNYRYLLDCPISLYRDLFRPVRKIYLKIYFNNSYKNFDLMPLYLLSTFNIYGASQLYYPEYVSGFGDIRNIEFRIMKKSKTILFYGFDITSDIIIKKTILNIDEDLGKIFNRLIKQEILFFSIKLKKKFLKIKINNIINYLDKLYKYKSIFEI